MTEYDAVNLKSGDVIEYHGSACRVIRVHKNGSVLVECQTIDREFPHWHLVRPGGCRKITQ